MLFKSNSSTSPFITWYVTVPFSPSSPSLGNNVYTTDPTEAFSGTLTVIVELKVGAWSFRSRILIKTGTVVYCSLTELELLAIMVRFMLSLASSLSIKAIVKMTPVSLSIPK